MKKAGVLHIVGTPIGNLQDITLRALETLKNVDIIYAEDTRHTRKLLSHFKISKPLFSYHDHSPEHIADFMLERIARGESIALVSDAGMPGFSDPGYVVIRKAIDRQVSINIIPGPSAILASLLLSGLPPYPFAFLGFPPLKASKRKKFFHKYQFTKMTLVVFEAPHRLKKTLKEILDEWGDRKIAIVRELTKIHEEVLRGKISELIYKLPKDIKGEITLVVQGHEQEKHGNGKEWLEELKRSLGKKNQSLSELAKEIARKYNIPKKIVYSKALEFKSRFFQSDEDTDNTP